MKTPFSFLALILLCLFAQNSLAGTSPADSTKRIPRFSKSEIGKSGAYAYFPNPNPEIDVTYSEDSSQVYTYEERIGEHNFALIHVKISIPLEDSLTEIQTLLSYLDFLKEQFSVTQSAGYGMGHTLEDSPETQGLIDYWEDADGLQYAIKAWVNKNYITVFLIYGQDEYPIYNVQQMYFNGIRY